MNLRATGTTDTYAMTRGQIHLNIALIILVKEAGGT